MISLRACAFCALGSLAFVAPAPGAEALAAELTMTVPEEGGSGSIVVDQLTLGETASIGYSNPDMANQSVVIDIDDGDSDGARDSITIELDATGTGWGTWTPPNWDLAKFNAVGATEVMRGIF